MAVPNIFGSATSAIPLSQLDQNFATAITLGNTAVYLGNTTTSLGNVTLTNVTISSGNVSVSTATVGAGSNTAPSITTTGDTNTGIFFPAADTIGFAEGGTEAMRIDSSGNVQVGTTTQPSESQVRQTLATSSSTYLQFARTATTVGGSLIGTSGQNFIVQTYTGAIGSETYTERMRIDSSGNLLVGTTTTAYGTIGGCKLTIDSPTSGGAALVYTAFAGDVSTSALNIGKFDNNSTSSQIFVKFAINNSAAGSGQINANGSGAATFASFSDSRLKENIVDLPSQLANICALRPVEFDYIESEGGGHQIGFIAQEVQTLYPDTVAERDDGMLTLSGWSKTEARLVKAIQEQQAIIQTLIDRITALEQA